MADEKLKLTREGRKKNRIGTAEAAALLLFACIVDLISLIPWINIISMVVGQGLIAVFLFLHGVNVFKGGYKKFLTYLISALVELIPFLSIVPAVTLGTMVIITLSRIEDKTGLKASLPSSPVPSK